MIVHSRAVQLTEGGALLPMVEGGDGPAAPTDDAMRAGADFQTPEMAAQVNAQTVILEGELWLVCTWVELTKKEENELKYQQMRAAGQGGLG